MGDRVRISRVDQSVVGVDDQSRGRVLDFRETVERYEALPDVASVGPRHGNLPVALLAQRAACRCDQADVSVPVGIEDFLQWRLEIALRSPEVGPDLGPWCDGDREPGSELP